MKISVELSMYPLDQDYIPAIIEFIESLKSESKVTIRTNGMSTQIFGEYDHVMALLNDKIKVAMSDQSRVVFVAKFLNTDVSDYKTS